MKKSRHQVIREIIDEKEVETQDELMRLLAQKGIIVTQATVSRDIREMHLVKQLGRDGSYHYVPAETSSDKMNKYYSIFAQSLTSVESAQNMVVIKCHPGTANAICVSLDSMEINDCLGTIAGDDTIFVVCKNEKSARDTKKQIGALLKK